MWVRCNLWVTETTMLGCQCRQRHISRPTHTVMMCTDTCRCFQGCSHHQLGFR
jgi:hypothetical protein